MGKHVRIVADIGGTNARFAYLESGCNELRGIEVFPCADFPFLIDAIRTYLQNNKLQFVDRICLAVAGTVELDLIDLTNNHWKFSRTELQRSLGVPVKVINDFTAQILSIDSLSASELFWVGDSRPKGGQVKVVVGPGTGLGVSAMLPGGEAVSSEGGHVAFAPVNDHEMQLLHTLWERYSRVSVERLLSGMGIANLYWANNRLNGLERELTAPDVTAGALAGDELCLQSITDFYNILGSFAGDIALTMSAWDGVYLSGGILPKIRHFLDIEQFRNRFEDKGRLRELCCDIPIALVLAEHPGLTGSAVAVRQGCDLESEI